LAAWWALFASKSDSCKPGCGYCRKLSLLEKEGFVFDSSYVENLMFDN
jgi:hypothetical protein